MATINLFPNDTVNGSTISDVQAAGANAPFAGKFYTYAEIQAFIAAADAAGPGSPAWDNIVGCIIRCSTTFSDGTTGPTTGAAIFFEQDGPEGPSGQMACEPIQGGRQLWTL